MNFSDVFIPSEKGQGFFWTKNSPKNIPTYFNPIAPEPLVFWQKFLSYAKNQKDFKEHIQYRNDTSQFDLKWNSGVVIDSDIYFQMNDAIISQLVCCGKCKEPLNCSKCTKLRSQEQESYNVSTNKIEWMKLFLTKHPYRPTFSEIATIQRLADEIINQIVQYLDIPMEEIEFVKERVILLRENAEFRSDHPDENGLPLLRYGYHIYFFNLKLNIDVKKFLKTKIKINYQDYQDIWPYTKLIELFDTSPFQGTTSLPLISSPSKAYTLVLNQRKIENIWENSSALDNLNPFGGKQYNLKSEYVKAEDSQNIVEYCEMKHYQSYLDCLRSLLTKDREVKDTLKTDATLKKLVISFYHPYFLIRERIVKCLYQYFMSLYKNMKKERIQLRVQLLFFIIMASKEDIDCAYNRQAQININPNWITTDDRARAPRQISSFCQRIFEKTNLKEINNTLSTPYNDFVKIYNKFLDETDRSEEKVDVIGLNSQTLYSDFINYVNNLSFGNFKDDLFYLALKDPRRSEYIQQEIIFKYLYDKIQQDLYVMGGNEIYRYQVPSKDCDYNKFHKYEENLIETILSSQLQNLLDGTQKQIADIQYEFGSSSFDDEMTFMQAYYLGFEKKREGQENNEFIRFCIKLDGLIMLSRYLTIQRVKLTSSSFIKLVIQRKLEAGTNGVMDQIQNVIGIYNGLLKYENGKLYFIDQDKSVYISKSTLFKVWPEMLDDDNALLPPDQLPEDLKKVYDEIDQIAMTIYANGKDKSIIQWKMYQIMARMFQKNIPAEILFISFGTGSDGKTTFMQALCNALGTSSFSKQYGNEIRQIQSGGYTSIAKSTILQTAPGKSQSHDSGGMIELKGHYFQLCAELQSGTPLVAATIKQLLGGTQIAAREAFGKKVQAFTNMCFMELQTNELPMFDKTLEEGIMRRVLFYTHKIKFISQEKYDEIPDEEKHNYAVADPMVQQKLFNDWTYIDMLGYYVMQNFLTYKKRDIHYVPSSLRGSTTQFFSTMCKYLGKCLLLIEKTDNEQDFICYDILENIVFQNILRKESTTVREDHMKRIRDLCKNQIRFYNFETQEEVFVSENNFLNYRSQQQEGILIIKGYKFKNPDHNISNMQLWNEKNGDE